MNGQAKELTAEIKAIAAAERSFQKTLSDDAQVTYARESVLALDACRRNDRLMEVARENPSSLQMAIVNIALVNLSLNPATQYAFLVPRDGRVCLDISYRGFIKIATDTGSIKWAQADVVYSEDAFEYFGPTEKPKHSSDPFSTDRGEMIGVYCVAKTADDDFLTTVMSKAEVNEVMQASKSATSKYSPWKKYPQEMWKKTVIKRAQKTWPRTDKTERLAKAIDIVNEHEGIDFQWEHSEEQWEFVRTCMEGGKTDELYVFWQWLENEEILSLVRRWKSLVDPGAGRRKEQEDKLFDAIQEGESFIESLVALMNNNNDPDITQESWEELSQAVQNHIRPKLNPEVIEIIEQE